MRLILKELFGLFVDDGFLALGALALIGVAALLAKLALLPPTGAAAVLALGCAGLLAGSALRAR